MEFRYLVAGEEVTVRVEPDGAGWRVRVNGEDVPLAATARGPGEWVLGAEGGVQVAYTAAEGGRRWVALVGEAGAETYVLETPRPGRRARRGRAGGHASLAAQMPGVVRRVLAQAGDAVEAGQLLVVLEAMKMEIRVTAPSAGTVAAVTVAEGQAVERGQPLVELADRE